MRRRRPEEERDTSTSTPGGAGGAQTGILALQQSAGNHAVSQMLARDKKDDAKKDRKPSSWTADLDKGKLIIPVLSVTMPTKKRVDAENASYDVDFTSWIDDHSGVLLRKSTNMEHIESIRVEGKGLSYTLHDCFVTSYQTTGSAGAGDPDVQEAWSVNCQRVDYKFEKPPDEKKPDEKKP